MGDLWLTRGRGIGYYLAKWGMSHSFYPGWERRSRSSGGFDYWWAIQEHHTATPIGVPLANACAYSWDNAANRPIGNFMLNRDGHVVVGAAGATNTSGKGGPRHTANGTLPLDVGNTRIIAIEAVNNGMGERWSDEMCRGYVNLVCAIKDFVDNEGRNANPIAWGDVHLHREWALTRKVDARGPSWWGTMVWDADAFRGSCAQRWVEFHRPTPPPPPPPEEDDMALTFVAVRPDGGTALVSHDGAGCTTTWLDDREPYLAQGVKLINVTKQEFDRFFTTVPPIKVVNGTVEDPFDVKLV